MKDYYRILQVDPAAEQEVIEAAYRRLSLKYHPDNKSSGSTRRMQELNEAYETLCDPQKRSEYDRQRHAGTTRGYAEDGRRTKKRDERGRKEAEKLYKKAYWFINQAWRKWRRVFALLGLLVLIILVVNFMHLNFLDLLMPAPTPIIAEMVSVPAGEFTMGSSDADGITSSDEKPQHTVYLDAFWMDKFEVTNAQYKKCVDAGKCAAPRNSSSSTRTFYYSNSQYDNYPVIYVSWNDAKSFCEWAGKRLPTEAEWEKAARGTDGRIYPWGNTFDKDKLNSSDGGKRDTTAVGNYPSGASSYGALDMAGNVWEWVADWYDEKYYTSSPRNNPTGPSSGQYRVLRGGASFFDLGDARAANREKYVHGATDTGDFLGFRCAQ